MRTAVLSSTPDSKQPSTVQDHGTSMSSFGEIPIDPALMGPVDKEPLYVEHNGMYHAPQESQFQPIDSDQYPQDYPQGPQGDPFAPQPSIFFPPPVLDHPLPAAQKSMKRKRKQKKCDFCGGNDTRNKDGQPEVMLSCVDCDGPSGHLSCLRMKYTNIEALRWKCATCKSCEICGGKDNDEDLLLCDGCDRGWHRSCLVPPMEQTPEGDWFCSACSILEEQQPDSHLPDGMNGHYISPPYDDQPQTAFESADIPPTSLQPRATSVASSSLSQSKPSKVIPTPRRRGRPPKQKIAPATDQSLEVDVQASATPLKRNRIKSQYQPLKKVEQSDDELATPASRQPKRMRIRVQSPAQPPPPIPKVRIRLTQKGKGKGRDREEEEPKGLFEGVLGDEERDTSKTVILLSDKQRFEKSRAIAEEKLAPPPPPRFSENAEEEPVAGPSSRPLRSSNINSLPFSASSNSPAPSTPGGPLQPNSSSHALRIRSIRFGAYEIKTWYDAPFPEEYANIPDGRLWICEFCLKYQKSKFGAVRHQMKCKAKHPPGDEIYRDGSVSIFEVDGRKNKIYCQNLCLLSKMYLDHKSLFYDVEPFLFYVMTEVDDVGARFVGYFSKEKRSPKDYNVSCIMTLPVRQRQGWGNLLIDFSYLLSKKEQRTGSPEKPLSALGAIGYKNYWTLSLMRYLETAPENPQFEDISAATSMTVEDIYNTLVQQNMITARLATPPVRPSPGQSIKYIKGRKSGGVARRHLQRTLTNTSQPEDSKQSTDPHQTPNGPFVPPKEYEITWDPEVVQTYLRNWEQKGYLRLRAEKLKWSPFLLIKGGPGGEIGVVKKTEAKGAMDTGGGDKLIALKTDDLSLEGSTNPETETPTPLSLFDDDNVVNAAEMELPDLSTPPPPDGQLVEPEKPASAANGRISDSSGSRSESPSPKGRKVRTKGPTSKSGSQEGVVNGHTITKPSLPFQPQLASAGDLEPSPFSDLTGIDRKDNEEQGKLDVPTPKRKGRPPKKGKKQVKSSKEDIEQWGEEDAEGDVEGDGDESQGQEVESREARAGLTSFPVKTPYTRLRTRSSQKSVTPPFLQVDSELPATPKPRQLRTRAVAVASGDTGVSLGSPVQGELQRTSSVNGRKLGSQRKRRRVESSPEPETDALSEAVAVSVLTPSTPVGGNSELEDATAATSLLSLHHSEPTVFVPNGNHSSSGQDLRVEIDPDQDFVNIKGEDTGYVEMNVASRHSIPSDVTVFGNDTHAGGETVKSDEQMDVDMVNAPLTVQEEDGDLDADASADSDDGDYDLDDALD